MYGISGRTPLDHAHQNHRQSRHHAWHVLHGNYSVILSHHTNDAKANCETSSKSQCVRHVTMWQAKPECMHTLTRLRQLVLHRSVLQQQSSEQGAHLHKRHLGAVHAVDEHSIKPKAPSSPKQAACQAWTMCADLHRMPAHELRQAQVG